MSKCAELFKYMNEYDSSYEYELNNYQERLVHRLASKLGEFIADSIENEESSALNFLITKDKTEKYILEYSPKNQKFKYVVYTPKNPKDKWLLLTLEHLVVKLLDQAETMELDISLLNKRD